MLIQTIPNLNNYNNYQAKLCNNAKKYNKTPLSCDTFTRSVSFKGGEKLRYAVLYDDVKTLKQELEQGTDINDKGCYGDTAIILTANVNTCAMKCFKELRKHPELDIYAEDNDGWMCFTRACSYGHKDIIQDLCDDPNFDVNYQSKKTGDNGLIAACINKKDEVVDIILRRDDVDLTRRNEENKSAFDCAKDHPSILKKLKKYEARQKERAEQNIQAGLKKFNIDKIAPKGDIWTEKERQKFAKMIERNDYTGIMKLLEQKGNELNNEYEQFKKNSARLTEKIQSEVRTNETKIIRQEEQKKAAEVIAAKDKDLELEREKIQKRENALGKLTSKYNQLVRDQVAYEISNIRGLYGIKIKDLPNNMGYSEQLIYVTDTLLKNKNKLADIGANLQENITNALQNENGQITNDGLKFLERILQASEKKLSEEDLINSIETVKNNGIINIGKMNLFIASLALGQNSITNVIKIVKNSNAKIV